MPKNTASNTASASKNAAKTTAKSAVKATAGKTAAKPSAAKAAIGKTAAKPAAKPPKQAAVAKSVKPAPKGAAKPVAKAEAAKPAAAVKPVAVKKPAPAQPEAAKPAAKPALATAKTGAVKAPDAKAAPPRVEDTAPKKPVNQRHGFKANEFIVYPSHGVGQILAIEEQEIAGAKLELFVINFIKDKMTLRVPTSKIENVGMRKLSEPHLVKKALDTLKGRARIKRTMWSRRAQEYEAKINSGDIVAIAEVVRDLYRSESQPEQSYSERQLYEAALDRLSREISAVQQVTETEAIREIEAALAKGPRRGAKAAEAEADAEGDSDDDVSEDEAA